MQPGLLLDQPQKSMSVNSFQLIKFFCTRTVPAAKTKSIGLQADAQVSWFLHRHLDSFIVTRQLSSIYRDLVPSRQFHRDTKLTPIYRDWQKTSHRDPSLSLWAGSDGT